MSRVFYFLKKRSVFVRSRLVIFAKTKIEIGEFQGQGFSRFDEISASTIPPNP